MEGFMASIYSACILDAGWGDASTIRWMLRCSESVVSRDDDSEGPPAKLDWIYGALGRDYGLSGVQDCRKADGFELEAALVLWLRSAALKSDILDQRMGKDLPCSCVVLFPD